MKRMKAAKARATFFSRRGRLLILNVEAARAMRDASPIDGLTDAERTAYAKSYSENEARMPAPEEVEALLSGTYATCTER